MADTKNMVNAEKLTYNGTKYRQRAMSIVRMASVLLVRCLPLPPPPPYPQHTRFPYLLPGSNKTHTHTKKKITAQRREN